MKNPVDGQAVARLTRSGGRISDIDHVAVACRIGEVPPPAMPLGRPSTNCNPQPEESTQPVSRKPELSHAKRPLVARVQALMDEVARLETRDDLTLLCLDPLGAGTS